MIAGKSARDLLMADLLRYLRVRERTAREVEIYLRRRGHDEDLIVPALTELLEQGLVDDRRFAEMLLRDRRCLRPMSRAAVLRDLRQLGVAAAVAREALESCNPPWDDEQMAWEAVGRRWRRWRPEKRRQQAARFLQRRGFSTSIVRSILIRLEAQQDREAPAPPE